MQIEWQPGCNHEVLEARAAMLKAIRRFFDLRDVLEVETPLLSRAAGTDPQIESFKTIFNDPGSPDELPLYLNSSPEFSMKRLLAAGSGSIFQICKAFRNGEAGRFHNPEFSILEWYRVDFDLQQLIDEVELLIQQLIPSLSAAPVVRQSYSEAFQKSLGISPLTASIEGFSLCANKNGCPEALEICGDDRSLWLDFLFSHFVQPSLGKSGLCFVYGFPACQASLARLDEADRRVAERVELFINGVELGNGFYELSDSSEQQKRFLKEMDERKEKGLPDIPLDSRLIAALEHGLPNCSGIAIGLDRLLMIMMKECSLDRVMSFSIERA